MKEEIRWGLLGTAIFLAFVLLGAGRAGAQSASGQNEPGGRITLLEGSATLVRSASAGKPAAAGQALSAGDSLQTAGKARAELTFTDGSVVRLGPDTSVQIASESGKRPSEMSIRRFQMHLTQGRIWVKFPGAGEVGLQILAAGALVTGPGSTFAVTLYPGGAGEIKTYIGKITVSGPYKITQKDDRFVLQSAATVPTGDAGGAAPWQYWCEPYRKIIVRASGVATKPFRFAAVSDRTPWVAWNEKRDKAGQ